MLFILLVLLSGCGGKEGDGGGSTNLPATTGQLQSIQLTASSTINPCVLVPLTATAYYTDGTSAQVTNQIQWGVDATTPFAVVSASGVLTGFAQGAATVYGYAGNISGSAVVTISASDSITLTPTATTIAVNGSSQVAAQSCVTSRATDVSTVVTWSSSNTTIATVDGTGKVTGVASGSATITATAGTLSNSVVMTVQ